MDTARNLTPEPGPVPGFSDPEEPYTMTNTRKPRSPRPDPAPDTFAARVRDTMHRLNLDEASASDYLGVPVFTLRKWCSGERQPNAAVIRLLDVLGMVEAMAPALHASFLPSESRHVEKSGAKRSTGSTHNSVMSKNPV